MARLSLIAFAMVSALAALAPAKAEPLAKTLFGAQKLPAAIAPAAHGFYSKGCFAGGQAIAMDGPNWQVMRPSRNRRWGHPVMISMLEKLSRNAARDGWSGLMVGDISQPRGGPMLTGHASHQIGLDADIWFTPMPGRRLSTSERESLSAISMLKGDSLYVDDRIWTAAHEAVLRNAAAFPEVERILVHPGIKKKLCDTVKGNRGWLSKVRPFWGHNYHFHVRIGCPAGSPGCKGQAEPSRGDGCDKSLAWWFTEEPWRKPKPGAKAEPKARDVMTMAALPTACRTVLAAPSPASADAVTVTARGAPEPSITSTNPVVPKAGAPVAANAFAAEPAGKAVPLPTPRPSN